MTEGPSPLHGHGKHYVSIPKSHHTSAQESQCFKMATEGVLHATQGNYQYTGPAVPLYSCQWRTSFPPCGVRDVESILLVMVGILDPQMRIKLCLFFLLTCMCDSIMGGRPDMTIPESGWGLKSYRW